jgi:hypothetical protein
MLQVLRTLEGGPRQVLHLPASALGGRGGAGWWIASTGGVMKVLSGLSGFLWERDYGVRGRATPPRERIVASGLLEKRRGSRRRLRLASGYPRERSWKL